ncbi:uncharacterized protein LOC121994391 [Zingiber officinale]|uniref:uncharacterized protein LOC121994391 n=1 Tax=Zingiber officinale TaxID=94328 RepID=UPI001C4C42F9|nr:uncharacterized protein LOC121994391 [Zingiber officinale]
MEKDGDNVMVVVAAAAATTISPAKSELGKKKKKKAKKKFSIIRATFIAIRRFFSKNKPRIGKEIAILKPSNGGDGVLKGLGFVGTVRPLCLQGDHRSQSLPPLLPPPPPSGHEAFHDVCSPPHAPSPSHEDCISRYASAEDLQALDDPAVEEGSSGGGDGAPKVVDEWAEEFIAKFYHQMCLQRQNSVDDREEAQEDKTI